jgi:alkyl hydroperoxide reductase subunit D
MSLNALRDQIPDAAKDIRLNLGALANETLLTEQQKWGAFFAAALASRNSAVIRAIAAETKDKLTAEAANAVKSAAAIMAMNNIYYRATHLMHEKEYAGMRANLRMNVLANPGVDKADFELWEFAVSAVNGCGGCLDAHEKASRKAGLSAEQVQTALRIASVVHAAAAVLDGEAALARMSD